MTSEMENARALARRASKILVFTGAGISTGSGIPDFRGPGGAWTRREPVLYQDFINSTRARQEYWRYKAETFPAFRAALPNAAHQALVQFERTGRLLALVTQNIDSLHRAAGTHTDKLIELHGSGLYAECLDCYEWTSMEAALAAFAADGAPPLCACGGWLKPAVVMFGEPLERENLIKAFKAAETCDLVVSIGSSLSVEPAASVPMSAKAGGKPYIVVNRGVTAHDRAADVRLEGDACALLPALFSPD
ncbi:MAG TPA: Sir2 family NAD-dependent protein deacetylase [Elusimicrobiales bacterium]|nr:Sir2 family NAD-dependent protein deacetylase [Elusimicrobiales bacterium]